MNVPLSTREIEYILSWKHKNAWPDEQRVLKKLRTALIDDIPLQLSVVQAKIVRAWVEEKTSGHYGGGQIINVEESSILHKLHTAIT